MWCVSAGSDPCEGRRGASIAPPGSSVIGVIVGPGVHLRFCEDDNVDEQQLSLA
jgi:hypothetical protein